MTRDLSRKVSQLNKKRNLKKTGYAVLSILMCVTVFITTYALIVPAITIDAREIGFPRLTVSAEWDDTNGVPANISMEFDITKEYSYQLEYSTDNGSTWTAVSGYDDYTAPKNGTDTSYAYSGASLDTFINGQDVNVRYHVRGGKKKNGAFENNTVKTTYSVKLIDILDGVKSGFSDWMEGDYLEFFCETDPKAVPQTKDELLSVFDSYYHLTSAFISVSKPQSESDPVTAVVHTDVNDTYTYVWQRQVTDTETGETVWEDIPGKTGAVLDGTAACLPFGGTQVRCKVYKTENGEAVYQTTAAPVLVNPQQWEFDQAVTSINTGLGLSNVTGCGDSYNLKLDGSIFNKYLYFDGVAKNPDVPFDSAETYRWYLCKTYLEAYNALTDGTEQEKNDAGVAAARAVWNRYLYDIFDPGSQNLSNTGSGSYLYPTTGGYADGTFAWPKSADSSFHGTIAPHVDDLNYDFVTKGVDYTNFVSGLSKYATADAAGDANTERKYNIDITADATAKARAPVALIFQIQTSWQLFDIEHANAVIGDGGTEVGAVAYNTEMATLYDIKCALLDFVEYMDTTYPGNNMVVGVVEVQHNGSSSMFKGTDKKGAALYVSNDTDVLRDGIIGWDIFGNCEHVHYDNNTLVAAVTNLPSNLYDWKDFYGTNINYDDIQKVCVVVGGPTENSNSTNGLGCTLPWSTFKASKINSVYSVRVNEGTPLSNNVMNPPIISWLDYSANNGPQYKDGNSGTGFTEKYVATSREALFDTFVKIAEKEMSVKFMDITPTDDSEKEYAETAFVEDVSVSDTVRPEFRFDPEKPVSAVIRDKDGNKVYETLVNLKNQTVTLRTYASDSTYTDTPVTAVFTTQGDTVTVNFSETLYTGNVSVPNRLVITENSDKTTDVSYDFGRLYNNGKAELNFGIIARDDYLGSNNVYTNVGTPEGQYSPPDGLTFHYADSYTVRCNDNPQVNVPLDFTTVNGGFKVIPINTQQDFYALDCDVIPDNIEDLMDNYGQTNGKLYYDWVGPGDDEGRACGYVVIKGGVPQSTRPSLVYEKTFSEKGSYAAALQLRFVPEDVSESGTFHDYVTKTAVKEKTHDGVANVLVIGEGDTLSLDIKKEWVGPAPTVSSISFKILKKDNTVFGTETLTAAGGWKKEITDLPALVDGEIQEYSVEEIEVPGYNARMSHDITTEYTYEGLLDLDFKPQIANPNDYTTMRVWYSYHGSTGDYKDFTVSTLTADGSNKFNVPDLDVDENGDPYLGEVSRIDYLNSSKEIYASFVRPDFNPYSVTSETCGCPTFTIPLPVKLDNNQNAVITYKIGDSDSQHTLTYTAKKNYAVNTTLTISDTSNLVPADTDSADITVISAKINNTTVSDVSTISSSVGLEKYTASFTAPKAFAKDKIVEVTIRDGSGNEYSQQLKLTAAVKEGEKVSVVFDSFLPSGSYTIKDITYDGATLADKTFVSFTTPVKLEGAKDLKVTITDGEGHTVSKTVKKAANAGDNVVVEFDSNPADGSYSVSEILYDGSQLKKKTEVSFTAPYALAAKDNGTIIVSLSDGTTESIKLGGDVKAGSLVELELATTVDTTGCTVTKIEFDNDKVASSELTDMTKVTFTAPIKITNDKDLKFTFWDGTNLTSETAFFTARTDVAYEAGKELTVTLSGNPDPGYVVNSMFFDNTSLAEKSSVSFVTPIEFKKKKEVQVTVTNVNDSSKTYTAKANIDAAPGDECTLYFETALPPGSYRITKVLYTDQNKIITDDITSSSINMGGGYPETTIAYGGNPVSAHLEPGGMYPTSVVYIGGNLPKNSLKLDGISRITANMLSPCAIPSGKEITVYYTSEDGDGSFTCTTTADTSAGNTASFRSGMIPEADYTITGVSRVEGTGNSAKEVRYYYDLNANVNTRSKLKSAKSTPHYQVVNTPATPLPATGGSGDRVFAVIGAAMMLSASLLGIVLKARAFRKRI